MKFKKEQLVQVKQMDGSWRNALYIDYINNEEHIVLYSNCDHDRVADDKKIRGC
jgi:hypothetical protein